MKTSFTRIAALFLCLCLLAGCQTAPAEPESSTAQVVHMSEPSTEAPAPDYGAEYREALAALEALEGLSVNTSIRQSMDLYGSPVQERQTEKVQYQALGSEDPTVYSRRMLQAQVGQVVLEQLYHDGTVYTSYNRSRFYSPETLEGFLAQQTPIAMLDPANYGCIEKVGEQIAFTEPLAAEAWALPAGAELIRAEGAATLADGALTEQRYELRYRWADTEISVLYSSQLQPGLRENLEEKVPKGLGELTRLDSHECILMLIRAANTLVHADHISRTDSSTTLCQAAGVVVREQEQTHCIGQGRELMAATQGEYAVLGLDGVVQAQGEFRSSLRDGVYTAQSNDEAPEELSLEGADLIQMGNTILNALRGSTASRLPKPEHLKGGVVYDLGDYWYMSFEANDAYARELDKLVNYSLFQDENKLKDLADSYAVGSMTGYLAVEKHSWLPTAMGWGYLGSYVIEGTATRVSLDQNISIRLYDQDTYEAITQEPLPDREPETRPSPVFYEVTDEAGHKLYLFGTIHVGDDKTAFLPQTIYDAFDAADALAVEFDDAAFEEELEADPALMEQIAEAYYYQDGTSIYEHLSEEQLGETASYFLRTTGNWTDQSPRMKPFVWANAIETFYLSQGRRLNSSKGVDHRLLARAREQEKEILNVESGQLQLGMMAGWSDKLQELLLAEAVSTRREEYLENLDRLYELWCQGDEGALIEELRAEALEEPPAELSEEELAQYEAELALYEEYQASMERSRNASMLETAQGYLDSGKTVFFAVGLAHLLGDQGLVDALRAAGYTVTLVQE